MPGARPFVVPETLPDPVSAPASRDFASSRASSLDSSIGFRRYEIVNTTAAPFVTHGRLFVEDGSSAWSCSATIVSGANEGTVATAGHCIYDVEGLGFPDAVYFAPGYRLGRAPFGYWPAIRAWVPGQWSSSIDFGAPDNRYDLGFLNLAPSPTGTTLSDAFGARGIAFNLARTSFTSFGYPAEFPFDGERLITCESASGGVDPYELAPQPNAMGCDMNGGSSGGGWVASGTSYVNSVVSYRYEGEPGVQYGPYFGEVAHALYAEAAAFGGVPPAPTLAPTPTPPPTPSPTVPPTATPAPTSAPTASPTPTPAPDTLAPYVDAVSDRPDPFSPDGDGVKDKSKISWSLSESVPYASIDIYRGYALVKSFGEGSLEAGGWFVTWAGRNNAGQKVKDGTYTYVIHVQDLAGNVREVEGRTTVDR